MNQRINPTKTSPVSLGKFLAGLIVLIAVICTLNAAPVHSAGLSEDEGCYTQVLYDLKYGAREGESACPEMGECDDPFIRDANIPAPDAPVKVIRLFFHLLRNDDGSNAVGTEAQLIAVVNNLNSQYEPWKLQFAYEWQFVNSTQYRVLDQNGEFDAMKNQYAVKPDSQLNIFVASVNVGGSVYSFGTFPWDSDALTSSGGIVLTHQHFPPNDDEVLGHEIGHCVGLWHTHHGVSEVSQCGACWESPNASGRDYTGDFCSDTDPTPVSYACGAPGGSDPCSGEPWGQTDYQNIMGYSSCQTEFSAQQAGRFQCWTDKVLSGWQSNVRIEAAPTFGQHPMEVSFSGLTNKNVQTWDWGFGDGEGSGLDAPVHTYDVAGVFDVTCDIVADDGDFGTVRNEFIWVYADTIAGATALGVPGEPVRVDVFAINNLPLQSMMIPFHWDGPLNLDFDSAVTTGLRSDYISFSQLINLGSSKATYAFTTSGQPPMAPGSGAVLSLWFTVPSGSAFGSNTISFAPYSSYNLQFTCHPGAYTPETYNGVVLLCQPGDVDGNGSGPDVADLTYLVEFLFGGGPLPSNWRNADVDGSGAIDVTDLTFLVDYLFGGGPEPTC